MAKSPEHLVFKVALVGVAEGQHPAELKHQVVAAVEEAKKALELKGFTVLGLYYQADTPKAASNGSDQDS